MSFLASPTITLLTIVLAVGRTAMSGAQVSAHTPSSGVRFGTSCTATSQAEFDRAVTLLHHMTYPRARESFEQVAKLDPRCAMAHWGIAMTLFQPLWPTRPSPLELQRGWDAVQQARALAPPTERERLLIDAVGEFFREPASTDYWQRIRRWEQGMAKAQAAFPQDAEVTTFYALAHLAAAPSDSSAVHSARAADLLVAVYERHPDHPGAMHYLVHANDAPGREGSSLDVTRKYESSAPRNPHALHMPTHIYTRSGDWQGVIRGNLLARDAALEHKAGDRGQFVWDEYPHAVEYLVYAYLQQGADDKAAAQLERMRGTAQLQPTFKTAFHLASTSARYALERHAWREAMSLVPRDPPTLDWDRFTWPEAVTWFARGLGAAREGKTTEARAAHDRLATLEASAGTAGEVLFARNIRILRLEVGAWLAHADRNTAASLALMRDAADLELATPKHAVTPGPTLPAYELWGDLLMAQANPSEALDMYRRSLELYPRRFNSVLGAARAAAAVGDTASACAFYQELLDVASGGSRKTELGEARRCVARKQ